MNYKNISKFSEDMKDKTKCLDGKCNNKKKIYKSVGEIIGGISLIIVGGIIIKKNV
jgi:hypothetical protein